MANKQGIIPGHKQLHCAMRHTEEGILSISAGLEDAAVQYAIANHRAENAHAYAAGQPWKQAKSILVYMLKHCTVNFLV